MIVCVRIPDFAAAVERCESDLPDHLPFVLIEVEKAIQVVYAASGPAILEGVRAGMTLRQAQSICSSLQVFPANPARYHRIASDIGETLAVFTPLVEQEISPPRIVRGRYRPQPSIREDDGAAIWFMNPGRMTRQQGLDFAKQLHTTLAGTTQIPAGVGLAANRFTARVAASSLNPGETTLVPRDAERDFLAHYPVGLLPIFPEQARQLRLLGIKTLGDLASLAASDLGDLFGGQGKTFKRLAEGRDSTPVREYVTLLAERAIHQFDFPIEDRTILQNVLVVLAEGLVARLDARRQMAGEVAIGITFSGGKTRIEEMALRQPSASAGHLSEALHEILDMMRLRASVIELEVTLGAIVEADSRQLSLFPPESIPQDRLRSVLRQLILRHGAETFYWANLTNPNARLPERRFELKLVKAA